MDLRNLRATSGNGVVGRDCVMECDLDLSSTLATLTDVLVSFWSLVFLQRVVGLPYHVISLSTSSRAAGLSTTLHHAPSLEQ